MTDTTITVQGRYSAFYPAERATVQLSAHLEGADREVIFAATAASAARIRSLIELRHDREAGPVTWFSSDSIQVWSEKPWSQTGDQLPPVFHSRVQFQVKFRNFVEFTGFVELVAAIEGATVGSIAWTLTEASHASRIAEVRSRAVKDAVAKASVYAQSIGLGTVRAVAVADEGMLGDSRAGAGHISNDLSMMRMGSTSAGGPVPTVELTPEDIELTAVIDARFVAS